MKPAAGIPCSIQLEQLKGRPKQPTDTGLHGHCLSIVPPEGGMAGLVLAAGGKVKAGSKIAGRGKLRAGRGWETEAGKSRGSF